jgi:hypothetical protein
MGRVAVADLIVGLDLYSQLLQVLDDRAIDSTAQVGVLILNDMGLVSYAIVDVLEDVRVSLKTVGNKESRT